MIYITLVCGAGMSTSMMMARMKESAEKRGIEAQIVAMAEAKFPKYAGPTDVLLLGPQVSYTYDKMKSTYEPKGIRVAMIPMADYGRMDGEKVLNDVLAMLEK